MSKLKIYSKERFNSFIEASRPSLSKRELESVLDCMIAEQLGQGGVTSRLERSFRDTFGYKHALALSSPMAAYHLALLSLEVKAGDHVILALFQIQRGYSLGCTSSSFRFRCICPCFDRTN